jgi:hypothetical protein
MLARQGFWGFGPLACGIGLLGAALALLRRHKG